MNSRRNETKPQLFLKKNICVYLGLSRFPEKIISGYAKIPHRFGKCYNFAWTLKII